MTDDNTPRWGAGRVAFVARLDTIRSEIAQGFTLRAIYERHETALGIGYSAFCKLVLRHADAARPTRKRLLRSPLQSENGQHQHRSHSQKG